MKNSVRSFLAAAVAVAGLAAALPSAAAAEWQWCVPVKAAPVPEEGPPRAFLWVPPECARIRGVVIGQHNMEEEPILEHPKFRAALAELGFAAIWASPNFDGVFRFDRGSGEVFNTMMADLAEASGYAELRTAPVVPIGHSAMASYPWHFAAWAPQRTLCVISVSGQWPFYKDSNTPEFGPDALNGVPGLVAMGEYEWADSNAGKGLEQRAAHPKLPLSMLACPGEGHFAPTDKKVEYLALYLKKAAKYRLPDPYPATGPVTLKPIDPTTSGCLIDRWHPNRAPDAAPALADLYTGEKKESFWCFDLALAEATEAYQAEHRGKKVPLLGYLQNGQLVAQNPKLHQQVSLKFLPEGDGLTFKLAATFVGIVPEGRPTRWTGKAAGETVECPSSPEKIAIERICGPVEKVGPDTFRVAFDKVGMHSKKRSNDLWFAATWPGDGQFNTMVQQASMRIPFRNTKGPAQRITFPALADCKEGARIKLRATSDANVPVSYYVLAGPATIQGDTLTVTSVPLKARLPVKVTVVAWQYGRSIEPLLQTAEPVEQSFYVTP